MFGRAARRGVIVSARPVWRERSRRGVCSAVGAASRGTALNGRAGGCRSLVAAGASRTAIAIPSLRAEISQSPPTRPASCRISAAVTRSRPHGTAGVTVVAKRRSPRRLVGVKRDVSARLAPRRVAADFGGRHNDASRR